MNAALGVLLVALGAGPTAADLAGLWAGTITHEGETQAVGLELKPAEGGKMEILFWMPVVHFDGARFGQVPLETDGNDVRLGPFRFLYDPDARTLTGEMPAGLVPVYKIPIHLRRVERLDFPKRAPLQGSLVEPRWTYEAGAALWAGPTVAGGLVFAGGQDGRVHAVEARTGKPRWSFQAGGAIRTRPILAGGELYVQADDGFLYKLSASKGEERWRVRIVEKPVERLPFDNPKSRYDRFGSDVTVVGARLYVGTHDGKVLALEAERGGRVWEFASGDAVLAAPAVAGGRVYFGSFDKHVYALEADSGRLVWKTDTKGAVVSTPALVGDRLVVGNRAYDMLGLDAATGAVAWKRYIWSSWIESSATVRDGIAYVGSSDAAAVYAFDAKTGEKRWEADVYGWAWGQPAVTAGRVYAGISGQVGYPVPHGGHLLALDRSTGRVAWRYAAPAPASGAFGFPGSAAVGEGMVFATGLDGRIYAFAE
jgi:outer membrane protein assembly factor BamB